MKEKKETIIAVTIGYISMVILLTYDYTDCCGFILKDYLKYTLPEILLFGLSVWGMLIFLILTGFALTNILIIQFLYRKFKKH